MRRGFLLTRLISPILTLASVGVFAQTPSSSKFDGPAELPRAYVGSSLADTPANGKVLTAKASGELQAALEKAQCGDRILLSAGAQFVGNFKFPAKSCDDKHWIVVRSDAADSALPGGRKSRDALLRGRCVTPGASCLSLSGTQECNGGAGLERKERGSG